MKAGEISPTINTDSEEDRQELPRVQLLTAMGALMGFLVVLLGFVISGWAWTCWMLNKLRKTKIRAR